MRSKGGCGRRVVSATTGVVLVALMSGCGVTPPQNRVAAVASMAPGSWNDSRPARAGIDLAWIRRFGDSQLSALVNESMSRNLDLRGLIPERDQRRFAEIYVSSFLEVVLKDNDEYLPIDRKSTRLNSSHALISYAVFCLKKKKTPQSRMPTSA